MAAMRWIVFIIALVVVYFVDVKFLHGQLTSETGQLARNVGNGINQQVADLLRPFRR
jgi:hypothetical protein